MIDQRQAKRDTWEEFSEREASHQRFQKEQTDNKDRVRDGELGNEVPASAKAQPKEGLEELRNKKLLVWA